MIASINLPGSKYFSYFHGNKKECEEWLEEQAIRLQKDCGGMWYNAYSPAEIVSDKKAKRWRYRDGSRVCRCFEGKTTNYAYSDNTQNKGINIMTDKKYVVATGNDAEEWCRCENEYDAIDEARRLIYDEGFNRASVWKSEDFDDFENTENGPVWDSNE